MTFDSFGDLVDLIRANAIIALALLIGLAILLWRFIQSRSANPLNKIPGPRIAKWVNWRLKLAIITGQRMYYVDSLHQTYGPYVRLSPTEISVADPDASARIHKVGSGFEKSQWYEDLVAFERPTLFTMTNHKAHSTRRKLLARAFSKTYLRQHWEGLVRDKVRRTVSRLKAESHAAGRADMLKWWTLMATDVATHLMFGDSFHMVEKGEKDEYIQTLEAALQGSGIAVELPWLRAVGQYLPFQPFKKLFAASSYIVDKAQIAVQNANAGNDKNLFAHIIREAGKGEHLDDIDVKLEAGALIVAGSDTTAVTLTYLIWAVLSQRGLTDLVQEELSMLSRDCLDRELEELPVLNAIVEETLRLYGAAPGGLPRSVPDGGATFGQYFLPGNTTVTTQAYTLHRDSKIFADPFKFDYTRWLPDSGSTAEKGSSSFANELVKTAYTPFGAGSRTCMGVHLARMELRHAAAEFFRECPEAKLAAATTSESMEMENFFLITPKSHRCFIEC